jgi:hypothetical protein
MNVYRIGRPGPAVVVAALVALSGSGSASARQDAGPARAYSASPFKNPVERVGSQIVRGDLLSGNDVRAPLYLPQR